MAVFIKTNIMNGCIYDYINMIPCFPANNSTDAHHCDIVSNRSSPSYFPKDSLSFSYFPSQNQVNYKKIKPLLGKSKRILFEK